MSDPLHTRFVNFDFLHSTLPEDNRFQSIGEAAPGTAWYIPIEAVVVDEHGRAWVDKNHPQDIRNNVLGTSSERESFVRIIIFDDVYVLDVMPFPGADQATKFTLTIDPFGVEGSSLNRDDYLEVKIASTFGQMAAIQQIFTSLYGCDLEGYPRPDEIVGYKAEESSDARIKGSEE